MTQICMMRRAAMHSCSMQQPLLPLAPARAPPRACPTSHQLRPGYSTAAGTHVGHVERCPTTGGILMHVKWGDPMGGHGRDHFYLADKGAPSAPGTSLTLRHADVCRLRCHAWAVTCAGVAACCLRAWACPAGLGGAGAEPRGGSALHAAALDRTQHCPATATCRRAACGHHAHSGRPNSAIPAGL